MGHPFIDFVHQVTNQLDKAFNGPMTEPNDPDKKVGFILVVFPLGKLPEGVASNGVVSTNGVRREDVIKILQQQAELFATGQIELKTEEQNAAKPN